MRKKRRSKKAKITTGRILGDYFKHSRQSIKLGNIVTVKVKDINNPAIAMFTKGGK